MDKDLDTVVGLEERWASLTEQLYNSWKKNAEVWTEAVRSQHIESRRLATDDAMVSSVLELNVQRVLDLGCGEGWLSRRLSQHKLDVVGVDSSEALIQKAQHAAHEYPSGHFYALSYAAALSEDSPVQGPFDAVTANFSLLEQTLKPVLESLHHKVRPGGYLLIQTQHPTCTQEPYLDGWRSESFQAMKAAPERPDWAAMPWYFRTLGSWIELLTQTQWSLKALKEPIHPQKQHPLSALFVAQRPED